MKRSRSLPSHLLTSLPQLATSVAGATTMALRATGEPCVHHGSRRHDVCVPMPHDD
jgi:hypothetical protein